MRRSLPPEVLSSVGLVAGTRTVRPLSVGPGPGLACYGATVPVHASARAVCVRDRLDLYLCTYTVYM